MENLYLCISRKAEGVCLHYSENLDESSLKLKEKSFFFMILMQIVIYENYVNQKLVFLHC